MMDENYDPIDVTLAFGAMRQFLNEYWIRGKRQSDDIADLLSSLETGRTAEHKSLDPALYDDWLRVCKQLQNTRRN